MAAGTSRRSFAIARESTEKALNGIARAGITCGDWIVASDQQRSDWLAAMPAEAQLFRAQARPETTHSIPGEAERDYQYGSEGGRLKRCSVPTGVSEAAGQRTDGAAKIEQRQFEMSVTFASALHVEQK